jgi:HAD superfamily hydrolase (TIGR01509 family)
MIQLKAVIFDVDGTLAETERDGHRVAFNRAFDLAGLDWHWDEQLYGKLLCVTGGKERIARYLDMIDYRFDNEEERSAFIAKLHADKTRFYVEILHSQSIGLRPGVARLIKEIHDAGLKLAIATTTTWENVTALISSTLGKQALAWFDCIAAGDVVAAKKPASDIFVHCLQQLGLDASQCLAVEDSAHGVRAAVGAGLATVVTVNRYTEGEDFSGAICVLDKLGGPDAPCMSLAGAEIGHSYVTVDDLKELHEQSHR